LPRPRTIAIDGPAGSGKSTICEHIAEKYGYNFVDTGVFYRAMTYLVLNANIALDDLASIGNLLEQVHFQIEHRNQSGYRVIANGEDITDHLRTKEVEGAVSIIAKTNIVREGLLPVQRNLAAEGNIILAGRDIATVVLPDADIKVYIDASLEERARRRHLQIAEGGSNAQADEVQTDLARELAPLAKADEAVYILTDGKTIDDVVQEISLLIENWRP
jgi:CMP/dCMP kinase